MFQTIQTDFNLCVLWFKMFFSLCFAKSHFTETFLKGYRKPQQSSCEGHAEWLSNWGLVFHQVKEMLIHDGKIKKPECGHFVVTLSDLAVAENQIELSFLFGFVVSLHLTVWVFSDF